MYLYAVTLAVTLIIDNQEAQYLEECAFILISKFQNIIRVNNEFFSIMVLTFGVAFSYLRSFSLKNGLLEKSILTLILGFPCGIGLILRGINFLEHTRLA